MIDALIKRASVAYKCYEMYAHRATARVLRSIKKWTPSYQLSALFTQFAESSINPYNNALISYFL